MAEPKVLQELFRVNDRFRRSVNLAADYRRERALQGYVVTPLVRTVLRRISGGLGRRALNRTWSITGPYGAGKSACAVFLARVLGYPIDKAARALLVQEDPRTAQQLFGQVPGLAEGGFLMVPIVGSRQPLTWSLLGGMAEALASLPERTPALEERRRWLVERVGALQDGAAMTPAEVAEAVEGTARLAQEEVPALLGLVIVYDELGKSLEYATLNPESADVGLLQILSETASRSQEPPIGLITILHQAFEQYASLLSPVQRREWEKVQGRFEDIGFLQSGGELLSLMDKAIEGRGISEGLQAAIRQEATRAGELDMLPREMAPENALAALEGCAPLHPSVALVVGRLFRSRLAQNERSLFAFLSSGEPRGFQEYLRTETWGENGKRPFYRLDRLYDYVQAALGSGLYVSAQGKRWAEIEEALERLPAEAPELDARLIKAIGMLGLLGDQRYLKASQDVLRYALADGDTQWEDVDTSLKRLEEQGIAIYRRHRGAYGLWEGSDVDLDEFYEIGRGQVGGLDLVQALSKGDSLKPYVAKRHLHETGTFRYLMPWVVDLEDLGTVAERPYDEADGAVVFVLPPVSTPIEEARQKVLEYSAEMPSPRREQTFFAIPHQMQGIREELEELEAWRWVARNVPELEGDSTARRELRARQLAARERLARAMARCFDPSSSYASSVWIRGGQLLSFGSTRQLAAALSDACDQVFGGAPIVKNELINRRSLSSAAAAARRSLIERMLMHGSQERLGLEGYPPEASIYLSVLEASGLHHREGDKWVFGPQEGRDPQRVRPLWQAMDAFFSSTEAGRRPVAELYEILRQPPFGIKEGLLALYLTVGMLHWAAEVALYEEGTFVPQVGIAEYERLLRAPGRFAVQRYRLDDTRLKLLLGYARLFDPDARPGEVSVLNCVRSLTGFARQLPTYTQVTDHLGADALAIRQALYAAREPQTLLFSRLPEALGWTSLDADADVEAYLQRLRPALIELQQAYGSLLQRIRDGLLSALHLPTDLSAARQEIGVRFGAVQRFVTDSRLQALIFRLSDTQLADVPWLESVAALMRSKPPRNWNDADARAFGIDVLDLGVQLRRVEEVALSQAGAPAEERVVRLGITDASGRERRDLLRIRPEQQQALDRAMCALQDALADLELDADTGLTAVTLLAQQMLEQRKPVGDESDD